MTLKIKVGERIWKNAMGFVPFNNVIKLEAVFTQDGQRVQNVHHFLVDETPNIDTAISLAAAYVSWWDTEIQPEVANTVSLVLVRSTILENETDPGVEYTVGLPLVGAGVGAALPNNVTFAVKWTTGFRGRSYRGRTFHIGLQEGEVTNNALSSGAIAYWLAAYGELMALTVDVGPAIMCIASRVSDGVERTVGVATPVIGLAIDATVDSQRRRLPGRGR